MKSILISLSHATAMGFAVIASGSAVGIAELATIVFASSLVGWTLNQYQRPHLVSLTRPIRLAIRHQHQPLRAPRHERLAA